MELTDKLEIKVFILFLLKNINEPLDMTTIAEVAMQDAFVTHFDFYICFAELLDVGQIMEKEAEGEKLYVIAPSGVITVEELQGAVFASIREKALRSAQRLLALKRTGNRIDCRLEELENGYMLKASIVDNEKTLLNIETYVADKDYADKMKKNFDERAEIIYKGAMALLSGDVNFIFDE